jgi:hypothetical protein
MAFTVVLRVLSVDQCLSACFLWPMPALSTPPSSQFTQPGEEFPLDRWAASQLSVSQPPNGLVFFVRLTFCFVSAWERMGEWMLFMTISKAFKPAFPFEKGIIFNEILFTCYACAVLRVLCIRVVMPFDGIDGQSERRQNKIKQGCCTL